MKKTLALALVALALQTASCGDSAIESEPGTFDLTQAGPLKRGAVAHEVFDPDGGVWLTLALTPAEYDALEVPEGWSRNQSRGGVGSEDSPGPRGEFLRSPSRNDDGDRLPFNTTVVRTSNQDSFQGPLPSHIEF